MAANGPSARQRAASQQRTPQSLQHLNSEFQRLQDKVYMEFPDFTRIMYDFKDAKEACSALFVQNKELFTKILHLCEMVKTSGNALSTMKLKSENIDLAEKLRSYSDLIVKLSNENDYYAKHIDNLLSQIRILKGESKRAPPSKLKLVELQEQLIIKEEEVKLLHSQLQSRGKVTMDARSAAAHAEALEVRLNAELADKELQKFSKQEFLGHMHTQAKAIEKLMAEVKNSSGSVVVDGGNGSQQIADLQSRNASLSQQLDQARKQLSALSAKPAKRPPSASLNPRQRAAMEEINDLLSLREIPKAAERWRELDYADLPMESGETTAQALREVLKLRDATLAKVKQQRRYDAGEESLLETLREKDAEIDVLKNTLLEGMEQGEVAALRAKVKALAEELRDKDAELQELLEDRSDSPPNETVQGLQIALKRKDQELRVLLDELVELRRCQEPAEVFRSALSDKNAKILRLETELGLFRGSPETVNQSIAAVLSDFASQSASKPLDELVQETSEKLKKVAFKSISDKLIEDAESKVQAMKSAQVDEMKEKVESLEAAVSKFRGLLEEEKEAHAVTLKMLADKPVTEGSLPTATSGNPFSRGESMEAEGLKRENATLSQKLQLVTQELERVRNTGTPTLSSNTKGSKDHVDRIKELQAENNSLKERIYDMEFQKQSADLDHNAAIDSKATAVLTLKTELERVKEEMESARKRWMEESANIQQSANEYKSKCQSMTEELDDRKLELSRIYKELDTAFAELKATKDSAEVEIAALKEKLLEKNDQLEDFAEQIKALTAELQQQEENPEVAKLIEATSQLTTAVKTNLSQFYDFQAEKSEDKQDLRAILAEVLHISDVIWREKPVVSEGVSPILVRDVVQTRSEARLHTFSPQPDEPEKAVSHTPPPAGAKTPDAEDRSKWAIAKWQSAEDELARVKTELAELKQQLSTRERPTASPHSETELKSLRDDLKRAKRTISELHKDVSERDRRADLESLRADVKNAEIDKLELEQTAARLRGELDYVQNQLKRCVADAETKETAWKEALARLKDLIKARFDLEKQPIVLLDPYVNPLAFLETLSSEFQDLNRRKSAERDKTAKFMSEFQEAKQAWSEKEEEMSAQLQVISREKATLEVAQQTLQSQLNSCRQELELMKEAVSRLESALNERPTEAQVQDAFDKGRVAGLSDAKRAERSELEAENKKLQSLLKDYKDSLEETKRKWKDTQERLTTTARLNSEMTLQLQTITRELEAMHEEKVRVGTDLQGKSEFFERVMREAENTKQFYHK